MQSKMNFDIAIGENPVQSDLRVKGKDPVTGR